MTALIDLRLGMALFVLYASARGVDPQLVTSLANVYTLAHALVLMIVLMIAVHDHTGSLAETPFAHFVARVAESGFRPGAALISTILLGASLLVTLHHAAALLLLASSTIFVWGLARDHTA